MVDRFKFPIRIVGENGRVIYKTALKIITSLRSMQFQDELSLRSIHDPRFFSELVFSMDNV